MLFLESIKHQAAITRSMGSLCWCSERKSTRGNEEHSSDKYGLDWYPTREGVRYWSFLRNRCLHHFLIRDPDGRHQKPDHKSGFNLLCLGDHPFHRDLHALEQATVWPGRVHRSGDAHRIRSRLRAPFGNWLHALPLTIQVRQDETKLQRNGNQYHIGMCHHFPVRSCSIRW